MTGTLYIIRGLPGSGKSTLGLSLATKTKKPVQHWQNWGQDQINSFAADDWFTDSDTGEYRFNPAELVDAHDECKSRVRGAMMSNIENICVCNTFTQAWEAEPYFKLCKQYDYTPVVLECQSQFGNVHGCPDDKIEEMRERWEPLE